MYTHQKSSLPLSGDNTWWCVQAHHSPAVGRESVVEDEPGIPTVDPGKNVDEEEPLLAFGPTNLLQHLYLALASPALFRLPSLAYKWSSEKGCKLELCLWM